MILRPVLILLSSFGFAHADMIANWKQMNGSVAAATSNLNTDGPTFGDGSDANAQSVFIAGRFGTVANPVTVTLAPSQTLTVSGELVLTGGAGGDSAYRFGVYNDDGKFDTDDESNWVGGWTHQSSSDLFQGRTDGIFLSTLGNAVDLNATKSNLGTLDKNSPTPLFWSFSVTRSGAGTVDLASRFSGGGGSLDQQYSLNDVPTSNFTYTTAGFLFGGGSSVDQAVFSNVQFNVIPEPSSLALLGLGLIAVACRNAYSGNVCK